MQIGLAIVSAVEIDALLDGGTFTITAWKDGERVMLSFADTGSGIPEPIRDKVLQPFVTQGKRDGTGLGLAIVKQVIEAGQGDGVYGVAPGVAGLSLQA